MGWAGQQAVSGLRRANSRRWICDGGSAESHAGEETAAFCNSSARHCLPDVVLARGIPADASVEIGQWSQSALQDRGMVPQESTN